MRGWAVNRVIPDYYDLEYCWILTVNKELLIPYHPIGLTYGSGNIRVKEYHVNRQIRSYESNHALEAGIEMMSHCFITELETTAIDQVGRCVVKGKQPFSSASH